MQYVRRSIGASLVLLACLLPVLASAKAGGIALPRVKPRVTPSLPAGVGPALAQQPKRSAGGVLRLAMPEAALTVDPALAADEQSVQLADMLYSGLVRLDASYHVVPDSAAGWTMGSDKRTYTFHLRRNLHFSNGDPVTARDFQFSITRSLSPALKSPSAATYLMDIAGAAAVLAGKARRVTGVKVLDRFTIRITARWPVPYFLTELAYPTSFALDASRLRRLGSVDDFSWYSTPIGSGPYRLKSWDPNNSMVLVPNKQYAGPHPSLAAVRLSFAPLPSTSLYRSIRRSFDVVSLCPGQSRISHHAGIREVDMLAIDGLYMNLNKTPFVSGRVRRALALSLNRPRIVSRSLRSTVTAFSGFIPVGEPGYDPRLRALAYDYGAARSLLAAAGYPGGKHFPSTTLYYADDPCIPRIGRLAQAIVKAWQKTLHLSIDARPLTANTLLAKIQADSLALYLGGWSADYPDPHDSLSLQWESSALNNDVHYSNDRFDALVQAADATWSYPRRIQLYRAAQQELVNDAAWLPLYIPHRVAFVSPNVQNLVVTGYGIMPRSGSWADVSVTRPSARSFHPR